MASDTKFTPGPWFIPCSPGSSGGIAHASGYVAFTAIPRDVSDERNEGESWLDMRYRTESARQSVRSEQTANAHLIAAAPDLYAVVEELEESSYYWSEYCVPLGIVDRLRAALAKARGDA